MITRSMARKRTAEEVCIQLSGSICMFLDKKISKHGEIYEGEQRHGDFASLAIAIKLVEKNQQNLTEARILAKLNHHSHVISSIDSGFYHNGLENHIYIALDRCHNENLREYVTNRKTQGIPFDLNRATEIGNQIITGVEYIHSRKIIHKDLKPDNILFSLNQKLIKIADFGLSQEIDSVPAKVFVKGQFGTAGYRPPESFGKSTISQKSDIYSLGVILYYISSNGEHPFGDDSDAWNYNMKNGIIDLSKLLVPNPKTTKHLIKCMIEIKLNDRPTIWQVSQHPCWSGNKVECDFDYCCDEASNAPTYDEEETLCPNIGDWLKFAEFLKKRTLKTNSAQDGQKWASRERKVSTEKTSEDSSVSQPATDSQYHATTPNNGFMELVPHGDQAVIQASLQQGRFDKNLNMDQSAVQMPMNITGQEEAAGGDVEMLSSDSSDTPSSGSSDTLFSGSEDYNSIILEKLKNDKAKCAITIEYNGRKVQLQEVTLDGEACMIIYGDSDHVERVNTLNLGRHFPLFAKSVISLKRPESEKPGLSKILQHMNTGIFIWFDEPTMSFYMMRECLAHVYCFNMHDEKSDGEVPSKPLQIARKQPYRIFSYDHYVTELMENEVLHAGRVSDTVEIIVGVRPKPEDAGRTVKGVKISVQFVGACRLSNSEEIQFVGACRLSNSEEISPKDVELSPRRSSLDSQLLDSQLE